jgi:hypothetical protein
MEYECIVCIHSILNFVPELFYFKANTRKELHNFRPRGGRKKHLCYLCNCAGSDVVMKQHPGSNSGAEAIKTAAAAGSMLHSMYPMQHVSVLSIPPTRWIATSLGTGALSQKHGFSWQRRPPSIFWFCCLVCSYFTLPQTRSHCNVSCWFASLHCRKCQVVNIVIPLLLDIWVSGCRSFVFVQHWLDTFL